MQPAKVDVGVKQMKVDSWKAVGEENEIFSPLRYCICVAIYCDIAISHKILRRIYVSYFLFFKGSLNQQFFL